MTPDDLRAAGLPARIRWADTPMVTIQVPVPDCPRCGCERFYHWRGDSNGDGSSTERAVCLGCYRPFRITRERSSESGKDIWWPAYDCDDDL